MTKLQAPVPREHLEAIGQIMVNFALLEMVLSYLAWNLLGVDQRIGRAVTAQSSFRNRMALVSSLFRLRCEDKGLIGELDEILKCVVRCEEQRNTVAHSFWTAGSLPEAVGRAKTTAKEFKGLKDHREDMTVQDLAVIADEIAEAAGAVLDFTIRHTVPVPLGSESRGS